MCCRLIGNDANYIRGYWIERGYDKMIKEDQIFIVLSFWRIIEHEGLTFSLKTNFMNFINVIGFYLYYKNSF